MKNCPYCGTPNESNVNFCTNCGKLIKAKNVLKSETGVLVKIGIILAIIVIVIILIANN